MRYYKKELRKELKAYRRKGVELYLNSVQSSPKEIAAACSTAEEGSYMREYDCDDNGKVTRLNFQNIKIDR